MVEHGQELAGAELTGRRWAGPSGLATSPSPSVPAQRKHICPASALLLPGSILRRWSSVLIDFGLDDGGPAPRKLVARLDGTALGVVRDEELPRP